jgi:hypothetical protein
MRRLKLIKGCKDRLGKNDYLRYGETMCIMRKKWELIFTLHHLGRSDASDRSKVVLPTTLIHCQNIDKFYYFSYAYMFRSPTLTIIRAYVAISRVQFKIYV